jgi:hypothetical protein
MQFATRTHDISILDSTIALRPHSFFLGACIQHSAFSMTITMMDAATGDRDKNKKDDAAAVSTTRTTECGPPPPASLPPYPPVAIGKVRCSLHVDVR